MEWTILTVKWEQALMTDPKSLPWNTLLKMEVDKAAMDWRTTAAAGSKHCTPEQPCLNLQVLPGVALYTWDQVQEFGFAAAEAAAGTSDTGVRCHRC
eukprot:111903-Rhodomonas_salina.4